MEQLFATLINIAFYIFIFKMLSGLFGKRKPPQKAESKEASARIEKTKKRKRKESFFEEAINQLKKLEQKEEVKRSETVKVVPEKPLHRDEYREPGIRKKKVIDEKTEEIYYNEKESKYKLGPDNLREAIVFSEILGQPVSKRSGLPYRR